MAGSRILIDCLAIHLLTMDYCFGVVPALLNLASQNVL